jgi:hypothetical protein
MVHNAYLFNLHIQASSFDTGWQGEMVRCREAFHGLGVRMLQSSIVTDVLSSACWAIECF